MEKIFYKITPFAKSTSVARKSTTLVVAMTAFKPAFHINVDYLNGEEGPLTWPGVLLISMVKDGGFKTSKPWKGTTSFLSSFHPVPFPRSTEDYPQERKAINNSGWRKLQPAFEKGVIKRSNMDTGAGDIINRECVHLKPKK